MFAIRDGDRDTRVQMTPHEMKEGSEAIDRFLRENIGLYYCDDCLSEETDVKDPRDVNQIKQALLTRHGTSMTG